MPTTPAAPAPDLVDEAVAAAAAVLADLSSRSIAAVDDSLTPPQFRLLNTLHAEGPLNLSVLAGHLAVTLSTVSRMVDRLVAANLISKHINPTSRREILVGLTRTGLAVVCEVSERRRGEIARLVARMPVRARGELLRVLRAFNHAGRT